MGAESDHSSNGTVGGAGAAIAHVEETTGMFAVRHIYSQNIYYISYISELEGEA